MRVALLFLLLFLVLLLCSPAWAQYGITSYTTEEETQKLGTVCLIAPDVGITAWHVSDGNNFLALFGESNFYHARVIASSEQSDLLLVRFDRPVTGQEPVDIGTVNPGQGVQFGGFGGKVDNFRLQDGVIGIRGKARDGNYYTSINGNAPRPGDSGGPVLDHYGHLVGIIKAKAGDEAVDDEGNGLGTIEPGTEFTIFSEIPSFLNHSLENSRWSSLGFVDPYYRVKKHDELRQSFKKALIESIKLQIRNIRLQLYIQENGLPVPAEGTNG